MTNSEQSIIDKQLELKKIAERLSDRNYRSVLTEEEAIYFGKRGFVVAFGVDDWGVSFRGAYHEDFYLDDDKIYFVDGDIVYNKEYCCADCKALKLVKRVAKYITPRYTIRGWQFDANFPHAYFPIMKDGVAFGEGIVFAYEDVRDNSQNA